MSECGCVPKPRLGWTRSSFITRKTPKSLLWRDEYSANEKWKRDLSQLELVHLASFIGLPGLPNHDGSGSDTKRLELGTTLILGDMLLQVFAFDAESAAAVVLVGRRVVEKSAAAADKVILIRIGCGKVRPLDVVLKVVLFVNL